jgi:hypothetical protein
VHEQLVFFLKILVKFLPHWLLIETSNSWRWSDFIWNWKLFAFRNFLRLRCSLCYACIWSDRGSSTVYIVLKYLVGCIHCMLNFWFLLYQSAVVVFAVCKSSASGTKAWK